MTYEQRQAVALFRYGIIAPLETGSGDPSISNSEFFRRAAARTHTRPDGREASVGASTIERWHRAYQRGGFDALLPRGRSDEGTSRKLDPDAQSRIRHLMGEHPGIRGAEIHRILLGGGDVHDGQVSLSTVERFVRAERGRAGDAAGGRDMRRYERAHVNEVWYGDTLYGPWLKDAGGRRRVYLIALIDDASRFVVAADLFLSDCFENVMSVIRSAVSRFGRPGLFTFDNGGSYRNAQMELLAARIGSSVHYCEPFTPTGKAKVERWFLTVRMQYLASLDMGRFRSLDELRTDFAGYVARYNRAAHSSLDGRAPQDRYFDEPDRFRRLPEGQLERDFLLEAERRVSPDSVVVINKTEYEVHYRYARQRIRLRYSPDMERAFVVEPSGEMVPIRLLNKQDNALVKRERVRLSDGGDVV